MFTFHFINVHKKNLTYPQTINLFAILIGFKYKNKVGIEQLVKLLLFFIFFLLLQ